MKKKDCDILIVGGGLSGLLTAYVISLTKLKVIIIDEGDFDIKNKFLSDLRTTAVAEGSKVFFEKILLWNKIKSHAEPIKEIRVFDRKIKNNLLFHNAKGEKNLGYVVQNSVIRKVIIESLHSKKNITMLRGTTLIKLENKPNSIDSFTNNGFISAKLLVAADGKKSLIRKLAKTKKISKQYNHSAMVVNIDHSKSHKSVAHEIFFKSGPLAILPMKSQSKKNYSSSIIWSNHQEESSSLEKINPILLKKILEEKIYDYVGEINKMSQIKYFPLTAHLNKEFYSERLVYVGDSAHSLHPIAGQGWNLGVRDIKNLSTIINNALKLGLDHGSEHVCKKYSNEAFKDAYSLFQITDKLNFIFLKEQFILKKLRNIGFSIIKKNKNLKNLITNYAMGF